jgi:hypothetical protein
VKRAAFDVEHAGKLLLAPKAQHSNPEPGATPQVLIKAKKQRSKRDSIVTALFNHRSYRAFASASGTFALGNTR